MARRIAKIRSRRFSPLDVVRRSRRLFSQCLGTKPCERCCAARHSSRNALGVPFTTLMSCCDYLCSLTFRKLLQLSKVRAARLFHRALLLTWGVLTNGTATRGRKRQGGRGGSCTRWCREGCKPVMAVAKRCGSPGQRLKRGDFYSVRYGATIRRLREVCPIPDD